MRVSEFWQAVNDEFGVTYGRTIARDLVFPQFGDVSAVQAIERGEDPREVWLALCRATDVPQDRWYGVGQLPKK